MNEKEAQFIRDHLDREIAHAKNRIKELGESEVGKALIPVYKDLIYYIECLTDNSVK